MSELFDEDDTLIEESFEADDNEVTIDTSEANTLDARRRLEKMLEEKRLRDDLDDFSDFE
jgi:hypothetical protein